MDVVSIRPLTFLHFYREISVVHHIHHSKIQHSILAASHLDEVGEVEWRFLDPPLSLEVFPLEAPVTRHGDSVPGGLHMLYIVGEQQNSTQTQHIYYST